MMCVVLLLHSVRVCLWLSPQSLVDEAKHVLSWFGISVFFFCLHHPHNWLRLCVVTLTLLLIGFEHIGRDGV
jgi:hypothetical protein